MRGRTGMLPSIFYCQSESQPCHTATLPNDWGSNHQAILSQSTQLILSIEGKGGQVRNLPFRLPNIILGVKVILSLWSLSFPQTPPDSKADSIR